MILNVASVILLFVDLVCFALACLLLASTWTQLGLSSRPRHSQTLTRFEQSATLGLLVSIILIVLRALNWPLMYATLQSFVPSIDGAMCIYGVGRSSPLLMRLVELSKPCVLFLAGCWFILHRLDLSTESSPLARKKTLFLLAAAALMLVEIPLEVALVLGVRPTFLVSCCTTVADVAGRPSSLVPTAVFGSAYEHALLGSFVASSLALIGLAVIGSSWRPAARRGRARAWLIGVGSSLALLNAVLAWLSGTEVIAPLWMRLPLHHCLYCFIAYRDAPLAVACFVLGLFLLWWAALTHWASAHAELESKASAVIRRQHAWSASLLATALGMLLVHLWVGQ